MGKLVPLRRGVGGKPEQRGGGAGGAGGARRGQLQGFAGRAVRRSGAARWITKIVLCDYNICYNISLLSLRSNSSVSPS
jgi:hypothetical protein